MDAFRLLEAAALPLGLANVDTDQIVPARYLQKPRAIDFGPFLFCDVRVDAQGARRADFPLNDGAYAAARIIVAGANFGCGSSREHAVWALHDAGFRALIAPSFGDIFAANAVKNGLLPVVLPQGAVDALLAALRRAPASLLRIDLQAQTVAVPGGTLGFPIDPFQRHCLLEGLDEIDYTLGQRALIEDFERGLFEPAPGQGFAR